MKTTDRSMLAVFFDLGDTIMIEATEVKDAAGVTLRADLVQGAAATLHALKEQGYRLALIADTMTETYQNVLRQHGLYELFDAFAISAELGCEKPDPLMFERALHTLGIGKNDRHRVVMVGNNLARDIVGARLACLLAVWIHWNERYPSRPQSDEQVPDYTVGTLPELLALMTELEHCIQTGGGRCDIPLARRHAPLIHFDRLEPFFPALVGCTVADRPLLSPSFPRILRPPVGGATIEYAIYWDWDIGHHYELEHLWIHLDAKDQPVRFEGSWHGGFHVLWTGESAETVENTALQLPSGQLTVCSQPGKHAFAPHPGWFEPHEKFSSSCEQPGGMGMHVTPLYRGILPKTAERDRLAAEFLRKWTFTPTFDFSTSFDLSSQVPLVSWQELDAAIPQRVDVWMAALAAGSEPADQDLPIGGETPATAGA